MAGKEKSWKSFRRILFRDGGMKGKGGGDIPSV
jgi:hypothetical protein